MKEQNERLAKAKEAERERWGTVLASRSRLGKVAVALGERATNNKVGAEGSEKQGPPTHASRTKFSRRVGYHKRWMKVWEKTPIPGKSTYHPPNATPPPLQTPIPSTYRSPIQFRLHTHPNASAAQSAAPPPTQSTIPLPSASPASPSSDFGNPCAGNVAHSASWANSSPILFHLTLTCKGFPMRMPSQNPSGWTSLFKRGILPAELEDVAEGVRVRGVVDEAEEVAGVQELGRVLQDGGLELAHLGEDEVALLAAVQFDGVDGRLGFDGRVVSRGERAVEEGVQERGFAAGGCPEDVAVEDVAAAVVPARGCFGGLEGRHTPLGEPALKGDVARFVADGAGGETGFLPAGRDPGGRGEEVGELSIAESTIVVLIVKKEQIDEESVTCGAELGGCESWYVEFGIIIQIVSCLPFSANILFSSKNPSRSIPAASFSSSIRLTQWLLKALHLKVMHLLITQHAVLVPITQIKDPLQRLHRCRFQTPFLRIIDGRNRMRDGLLTQKEDLVYIVPFARTRSHARIDLLELGHHWHHLLLDHARRRLPRRHQGAEIREPEERDALVGVVIAVLAFLRQGRGVDDGGGHIFRGAERGWEGQR
ncbi:hypothetical protein KC340_g140 [Hortaea werneckii]|nr:hypothetical protein KC340_g140 [Hortaea werneckii]